MPEILLSPLVVVSTPAAVSARCHDVTHMQTLLDVSDSDSLSSSMSFPDIENTLSDATEDTWIAIGLQAADAIEGNLDSLHFHQCRGSKPRSAEAVALVIFFVPFSQLPLIEFSLEMSSMIERPIGFSQSSSASAAARFFVQTYNSSHNCAIVQNFTKKAKVSCQRKFH